MKYLIQFLIIIAFSFMGELLPLLPAVAHSSEYLWYCLALYGS